MNDNDIDMMLNLSDKDEGIAEIDQHVSQLMEHWDTVRIFVTRHHNTEGTTYATRGNGNMFAQIAQAGEWAANQMGDVE